MKKIHYFFGFCFLALSYSLSAWSKEGHHIICAITRQFLNDQASDSLRHYLGEMSFEEASVWMDEARRKSGYAYLNSWHSINFEKDETYVESKKPNIINRLQLVIHNLKQKNGDYETTQFNLKILMHLLSDLHQPLHVGFGADRGGNDAKVNYFERESNLHKVWDDQMIKTSKIDFELCLKANNSLPAMDKEKYEESNVVDWAMESRQLLTQVYQVKNNNISTEYLNQNLPILELQLLKAGRRLAGVLNSIYGPQ